MTTSAAECYAAVTSARTELAADALLYKCEKAFPDFLDPPDSHAKVEAKTSRDPQTVPDIAPVHAAYTTQDAGDYSEADLDLGALAAFEAWIIDTTKDKMRLEFAAQGLDIEDFEKRIDTESVYLTAQGKKLAVAKANLDNMVRVVTILGFNGRQMNRVTCIRKSNHDIPLSSGQCSDEIVKAFGVRLTP